MNRSFRLAVIFLTAVFLARPSLSADISDRLEKMAKDLTKGCLEKTPDAKGSSLAVMEFDAPEGLAKRKVNFAVSEILMNKFVREGTFTVVERQKIRLVMDEHALGLSGMVDMKTAVEVGKLLGAKFLVLGSVHKLGSKYQINSRLVEVETSEVAAVSFQEMDAKLFEQEAKPYLALVAERQTLGIYMGAGTGMGGKIEFFPYTYQGVFGVVPYELRAYQGEGYDISHDKKAAWVGAKFQPWPWLLLDLAYFAAAVKGDTSYILNPVGVPGDYIVDLKLRSTVVRLGASYVRPVMEKLRVFGGVGLIQHKCGFETSEDGYLINFGTTPNTMTINVYLKESGALTIPFLRAGVEYHAMERFGISLTGYYQTAAEWRLIEQTNKYNDSGTPAESEMDRNVMIWSLPPIYVALNASFYF